MKKKKMIRTLQNIVIKERMLAVDKWIAQPEKSYEQGYCMGMIAALLMVGEVLHEMGNGTYDEG